MSVLKEIDNFVRFNLHNTLSLQQFECLNIVMIHSIIHCFSREQIFIIILQGKDKYKQFFSLLYKISPYSTMYIHIHIQSNWKCPFNHEESPLKSRSDIELIMFQLFIYLLQMNINVW